MTKIVWMSDLHFAANGLVLGHDPRRRLELAIDHVNANHADAQFCVVSGDLVERALREEYLAVRERLDALTIPWLPMVGNHDDRGLMSAVLPVPEGAMDGFVQYVVETDDVVLLCLDTQVPGQGFGSFCDVRLAWLVRVLKEMQNKPIIVFMHHPPVALGLPMQDQDRLLESAGLLETLAAFPAVRQLCIGHVHRPITGSIRGIPFATMRSVLYQAPPPQPAWDWDSFVPAREAPAIGVMSFRQGDIQLHYDQFCPFEDGAT